MKLEEKQSHNEKLNISNYVIQLLIVIIKEI